MKENWKDKMKQSLDGFEMNPPERLWEDIDRAMSSAEPVVGNDKEKKQRTKIIVLRSLAAAACVACLVGIFLNVSNSEEKGEGLSTTVKTGPGREETASADRQDRVGQQTPVADNRLYASALDVNPKNGSAEETEGSILPQASQEQDMRSTETKADSTVVYAAAEKKEKLPLVSSMAHKREETEIREVMAKKQTDDKLTMSLFAMNSGGSSTPNGGEPNFRMSDMISSDPLVDDERGNLLRQVYKAKQQDEKAKHHAPLRAGLSVRYALTDRWGIESGLTYSYLSSDFSSENDGTVNEREQKLHFVGIPLNVDYSLWYGKRFRVYVSAGTMAELNVRGVSTVRRKLGGAVLSEGDKNTRMKRLQWSANAAVGGQLNITDGVGLYVEPGLSYYFDNGSDIKTAYTERQLNYSIKLGLRYSFK